MSNREDDVQTFKTMIWDTEEARKYGEGYDGDEFNDREEAIRYARSVNAACAEVYLDTNHDFEDMEEDWECCFHISNDEPEGEEFY